MELSQKHSSIHWEAAHAAVRGSVDKALALGVRVNAAVVDRSGIEIAFLRMPGAALHSMDVARDKAYTAASFGFPTKNWTEVLKSFSEEVQKGIILRPRLVVFGGGLPIRVDGEVIGAIGVSGASEEEDEICAAAGIAALGL